jgi:Raf kinase inhibitor-like YbhB/YbcL family protein
MRRLATAVAVLLILAALATAVRPAAAARPARDAGDAESPAGLTLTSDAFAPGERIPRRHTGEGEDISPPLSWSGVPEGTESFALIVDDPDAPREEPWVHWVLFNLPAEARGLAAGSAGDGTEGVNSFGEEAYGGPLPPPGHGVHRYHFRLYALDGPLALEAGATKAELLAGLEDRVLARAELVGTYER